jgi:hypothetical protein
MTLILTDISNHGVVMAADTAESIEADTESGRKLRVSFGMKKLQRFLNLPGMVATWGIGKIGHTPTDLWMEDFITRHGHIASLEKAAYTLRSTVQKLHGAAGAPELGFRVSGYESRGGRPMPVSYKISNYDLHGGALPEFEVSRQTRFSNLDHKPWSTADGDTTYYRLAATPDFLERLQADSISNPVPADSLRSRADLLVAWIGFISDLHHCAGLMRSIGGTPLLITISRVGNVMDNSVDTLG